MPFVIVQIGSSLEWLYQNQGPGMFGFYLVKDHLSLSMDREGNVASLITVCTRYEMGYFYGRFED